MLLVAIAMGYGAGTILNLSAMSSLADIADHHELNTDRRQEGIFYSTRTFVGKVTGAFGLLIGGIAIAIIGWPIGVKTATEVSPNTTFDLGLIEVSHTLKTIFWVLTGSSFLLRSGCSRR